MGNERYNLIVGSASAGQTQNETVEKTSVESGELQMVPLTKIQNRLEDTRGYDDPEIASLSENIGIVGLILPLALDKNNRLLCGGRRRAAIHLLKNQAPEVFNQHFPDGMVPSRVFAFDSLNEPDKALEVEASENSHRRDYTKDEVIRAAKRLLAAGYVDGAGRPKAGQKDKRLKPTLAQIFGKSLRQIQRYLEPEEAGKTDILDPAAIAQSELKRVHLKKNWKKIQASPDLKDKYEKAYALLKEVLSEIEPQGS